MKAEVEVFKLREERNRKKVELQDDLVAIFVNERVQNPYLKEAILRAWNEKNRKEMERVTDVWRGKINGMKKAYDKDKEFIRRHNQDRVKPQNNDPHRVVDPRRNGTSFRTPEGNEGNRLGPRESEVSVEDQRTDQVSRREDSEETQEEMNSAQGEPTDMSQIERSLNNSSHIPSSDVNLGTHNERYDAETTNFASKTASSTQSRSDRRSIDLEEVESDENFSDVEASQILFGDTQDNRNVQSLATLTDTSEDEIDDEENGNQQDFQIGYNLRKKRRKPRNSYSPQVHLQNTSQRKRLPQRSSTSRAIVSHQDR